MLSESQTKQLNAFILEYLRFQSQRTYNVEISITRELLFPNDGIELRITISDDQREQGSDSNSIYNL